MKMLKFIARATLLLVCVYLVGIALTFFNYRPYKLTGDFYLIGRGNEYSIKKGLFASPIVKGGITGAEWIITEAHIYGINQMASLCEYYIIDRNTEAITVFKDISDFNDRLETMGLPRYSITKSENIAHLKFGNSNSRRFKL